MHESRRAEAEVSHDEGEILGELVVLCVSVVGVLGVAAIDLCSGGLELLMRDEHGGASSPGRKPSLACESVAAALVSGWHRPRNRASPRAADRC